MINKYKNKKHVVMLSGGASSYVAAKRVIEWYGKEHVTLLFADTLTEDEDLYRFLEDIENKFNKKITRISQGVDIWGIFKKERLIGRSNADVCSKHLKRVPMDKWIRENYPDPESVVIWVGIGLFEHHRLLRFQEKKKPYIYESPLIEKPWLIDIDLINEVSKDGIEVPRLYKMGFSHNNCGGFCIKAGKAHFKNLLKQMPERYLYHEKKRRRVKTVFQ
jgi:hypothetical protein